VCARHPAAINTTLLFAFFSARTTTDNLELMLLHSHHFQFCPLLEQWSLSSPHTDRP
jgi:hypothetical protein